MRLNLRRRIDWDEAVIVNLSKEVKLKNKILNKSIKRFTKGGILFNMKGVSGQEFEQQ